MKELKKLREGKVYFPLTPCRWVGKPKVNEVYNITMSCGGGMGGSRWQEYVVDSNVKEGLNEYTTIEGKTITLNGRFIVKAERFYLVRVKYIHANTNFEETIGKEQELVFLSDTNKIRLVNEYGSEEKYYD